MKMSLFVCAIALLALAVASDAGQQYQKDKTGVNIPVSDGILRLAVYGPNAIRVTFAPGVSLPEIKSLAAIAQPDAEGWSVKESPQGPVLEVGNVRAAVDIKTGAVSFYSNGKLLCRETPGGRKLAPATIEGEKTLSVQQHFTVMDDEAFYGLGHDQSGLVNRAGHLVSLKQGNTDKIIPVLVSSKGYGIFWDNPSYGEVDLRSVKSQTAPVDIVIPSSAFIDSEGKPGGLTAEYFKGKDFAEKVATKKDAQVNFNWSTNPPASLAHDDYSVRWTGELVPDVTGTYTIATRADDGVRLWLDGKLIIDDWNAAATRRNAANIKLEAGKHYSIKLEFFQDKFDSEVQLLWAKPGPKPVRADSTTTTDISISAEVANAIDYYFLAGPTADEVISAYRHITGDAPMYGKWVFGYWQCKERYQSAAELLEVAEGFRSRNIPMDNIIQDWRYWDPHAWGSHEFDTANRYPDPAGLLKTLHEKYNLHVMISVWPKFMKGSSHYDEMEKQGFIFPEYQWFGGAMQRYYDPFNPKARELFWKQVKTKLFDLGIDAFWLDGDEPEVTLPVPQINGKDYGHPSVFHGFKTALGTGASVLNAYPLVHTETFYDGQRAATDQKRVFLLSRCSYAGMQRNAATCWSGDIPKDWDSLRKQIPAGLDFVMSGVPYWNTDIGGFWGGVDGGDPKSPAYRELFVRWIQYGTFCPMMRVHGEHPNKEPWRFGAETEKVITDYINLRYRLMPYTYSTAWMVTNGHYTMMRPLVMDFAADRDVRNIGDQFMFGPAIMVSPVTSKGATSREVYLPAGTDWVDFWTGAKEQGGRKVAADAPVERVPIYVRAGSVVPMGPLVQYAAEKPADPIELRVYPGADGSFTLYEDENDNYNYEKGQFSTITFRWSDKSKTLTIGDRKGSFPGMLKDRTFKVVLVAPKQGVGIGESTSTAQVISYSGKQVSVTL